jgi:hypothetical protein
MNECFWFKFLHAEENLLRFSFCVLQTLGGTIMEMIKKAYVVKDDQNRIIESYISHDSALARCVDLSKKTKETYYVSEMTFIDDSE